MAAPRGNKFASAENRGRTPLERFLSFCRFEPETGCVVWTGGKTQGRGHHVPYGAFWFEGKRWFAHRWAALHIHGQTIDGFQTDHCCPNIPLPNTLCVEHVQSLTPAQNRELQHTRRMIHLQVGLLRYEDCYGEAPEPDLDAIPFYSPPRWLTEGRPTHDRPGHLLGEHLRSAFAVDDDCPF